MDFNSGQAASFRSAPPWRYNGTASPNPWVARSTEAEGFELTAEFVKVRAGRQASRREWSGLAAIDLSKHPGSPTLPAVPVRHLDLSARNSIDLSAQKPKD
jgi:hypothetical protein